MPPPQTRRTSKQLKDIRILLYRDATVLVSLDKIAEYLNAILNGIHIELGREVVELETIIRAPSSFRTLPKLCREEAVSSDLSLIATAKRYDNNFFFDSVDNIVILSFADWHKLTNLAVSNGLVYFLTLLVADMIGGVHRHEKSRGCLNDFRWDKTDVDFGMRAAFLCPSCKTDIEKANPTKAGRSLVQSVISVLNDLSNASRMNMDILEYWQSKQSKNEFDVFLCHNSLDKKEVRIMSRRLKRAGLHPWLDEDQLRPGTSWQVVLEQQIETIRSAAILVGGSGIGPWQDMEIRAFLSAFVARNVPVIPVILPTCPTVPNLPVFLREFMWVDFRKRSPDPFRQFVWGITGKRPR